MPQRYASRPGSSGSQRCEPLLPGSTSWASSLLGERYIDTWRQLLLLQSLLCPPEGTWATCQGRCRVAPRGFEQRRSYPGLYFLTIPREACAPPTPKEAWYRLPRSFP